MQAREHPGRLFSLNPAQWGPKYESNIIVYVFNGSLNAYLGEHEIYIF